MQLVFSADDSIFDQLVEDIERRIDEAEAGAVQDAADLAVAQGRSNIAAAGFSARWQSAFQSKFFPNEGENPAALVFHSIPFAGVFETGVRIGGNPLLWIPIERNLPPGIHSPRQYAGKLVSVNVAGKPPLLFDAGRRQLGPLFFGTPAANIRKRFDLYRIIARAAARMREFYDKRIEQG